MHNFFVFVSPRSSLYDFNRYNFLLAWNLIIRLYAIANVLNIFTVEVLHLHCALTGKLMQHLYFIGEMSILPTSFLTTDAFKSQE